MLQGERWLEMCYRWLLKVQDGYSPALSRDKIAIDVHPYSLSLLCSSSSVLTRVKGRSNSRHVRPHLMGWGSG